MKVDLDSMLKNAPWPALCVQEHGAIRYANPAAVAAFGDAVIGPSPTWPQIWSAENEEAALPFLSRWDQGKPTPMRLKLKLKDGLAHPFTAFICSYRHEDQKHLLIQFPEAAPLPSRPGAPVLLPAVEAGIAHKQKLDCALQLIRTVVLDFNNALTSILGHTSLILGRIEPDHPWRNSLMEVEKSAEKAAEIANDLAIFSRQEKDAHSQMAGNLNNLLRRTVELFQAPGSLQIRWDLQLERRLYTVYFDEAKMQQALLKIFDNAVQAVRDQAQIKVQTRNLDLANPLRDGTATLAAGHYVCVEITDNGCGIAPDIMSRIFEPFFTTKSNHRGLGLAWVYGIVTNHGGSVTVASVPGQETQVRIYLPAVKRFIKDHSIDNADLTGHQTILFVDDERLMLTMGQVVLSSFGYHVLTAESAEKALEIIAQQGSTIDLVITDLVMPKMSGRQLIERLRQLFPEVKVLCCSGYVHPTSKDEDEGFLRKPFTSQELLRKVKQILTQLDLT